MLPRWLSGQKNLPTVQETWIPPLGWEDPLEKEMETCSSILVWKIPWTEEPSGLQSMELQGVGRDWARTHTEVHSTILDTRFFVFSDVLLSSLGGAAHLLHNTAVPKDSGKAKPPSYCSWETRLVASLQFLVLPAISGLGWKLTMKMCVVAF